MNDEPVRIYGGGWERTRTYSGSAIRVARQVRRVEFEDLADRCGLTQMEMLAVEQGRAEPTAGLINAVSTFLEFPANFFEHAYGSQIDHSTLFDCQLPRLDPEDYCAINGCGDYSDAVCDFPVGNARTCDRGMCGKHRVMVDEGIDLCDFHRTFIVRQIATVPTTEEITP